MATHLIVLALIIMAGINGIRAGGNSCDYFDGVDITGSELSKYAEQLSQLIKNRSGTIEFLQAKQNKDGNKFCFVFNVNDGRGNSVKQCAVSYAWDGTQAKSKSVSCASASSH